MKRNTYWLVAILIVMALLLAGIVPASAAQKTQFTCEETLLEITDWGVWTYPDGNIHFRGMVFILYEWASDSRVIGTNYATQNANWGPDETGPVWGTFRIVNSDGWWEGTWNGVATAEGYRYDAVGKGFGNYVGLNFRWHMALGVCTGEIF